MSTYDAYRRALLAQVDAEGAVKRTDEAVKVAKTANRAATVELANAESRVKRAAAEMAESIVGAAA